MTETSPGAVVRRGYGPGVARPQLGGGRPLGVNRVDGRKRDKHRETDDVTGFPLGKPDTRLPTWNGFVVT